MHAMLGWDVCLCGVGISGVRLGMFCLLSVMARRIRMDGCVMWGIGIGLYGLWSVNLK